MKNQQKVRYRNRRVKVSVDVDIDENDNISFYHIDVVSPLSRYDKLSVYGYRDLYGMSAELDDIGYALESYEVSMLMM